MLFRSYKKWFLNLSAKVQKKNVKKERLDAYYGKNSVIIATFLNVYANSGRRSAFFQNANDADDTNLSCFLMGIVGVICVPFP